MTGNANDDAGDVTRPSPKPPGPRLPRIPGVSLEGEIARGGMGVVYRGRQDYLDRPVAVKLLAAELTGDSFVQRFQREAKILAGIKHPNIVACHQAGQTEEGQSYLVMEFIDGPSLKRWIADNGPAPVPVALSVTRAVAKALSHAHQSGIIHRDVKPENILLERLVQARSSQADTMFPFVAKVVDLGLARASEGAASVGLTSPGSVMGTPSTMSPEQFDDVDAVDFRTDIYGLGCVLFEMLVGKPAFRGKKLTELIEQKRSLTAPDPCALDANIPSVVGQLVQWMLARDRDARPASYKDLDKRLIALLTDPSLAAAAAAAATATAARAVESDIEYESTRVRSDPDVAPPPAARTAAGAGPSGRRWLPIALAGVAAAAAGVWLAIGREQPDTGADGVKRDDAKIAGGGADKPAGGGASTNGSKDFVANQPPTDVRVDGVKVAKLGEPITLKATARDPEGAPLSYKWTSDWALVSTRGGNDGQNFNLKLEDGLPGVEVPITVEVRDANGGVASQTHIVAVGQVPEQPALRAFKSAGSGWELDANDFAWTVTGDEGEGAACVAKNSTRMARFDLKDEDYWEWSGALDADEDAGTPIAKVTVAFLWGESGYGVLCSRSDDGRNWRTEAGALTVNGSVGTFRPLDPPLVAADVEPAEDSPEADIERFGWFRVQRKKGELTLQVGSAKKLEGRFVPVLGPERGLKTPDGDCRVLLRVEKGIGRFYLSTR